jgi:hypothetical protein
MPDEFRRDLDFLPLLDGLHEAGIVPKNAINSQIE